MTVSVPASGQAGVTPASMPAVAGGWGPQGSGAAVTQPVPTALHTPATAPQASAVSDAALLAASVRLRIEDSTGHSCGSGTIIDARGGKALILTCGHIFRDSQGKGPIEVDLFGQGGPLRVKGTFDSYDLNRDIGLVVIDAPGPVATARVAPPGYQIQAGAPVVSVGCNNGEAPTVQHSRVTTLDKFLGPPNLQVAGQPVEGRSGGGLFSSEGYVIGVCNAADPSDKEGLFAAIQSIYAQLDRKDAAGEDLSFVYKAPRGGGLAPATAVVDNAVQPAAYTPGSTAPASAPSAVAPMQVAQEQMAPAQAAPAALSQHELAALEEIQRRLKEGAEVTVVVRPRDNPTSKSEVFQLDHASSEIREATQHGKPFAGRSIPNVAGDTEAPQDIVGVVGRRAELEIAAQRPRSNFSYSA